VTQRQVHAGDSVDDARPTFGVRESERAEEALARELLNSTGHLISVKDIEGRYLFINRPFEKAYHVRQEQIRGKRDDEIFPPEQAAFFSSERRTGAPSRCAGGIRRSEPLWTTASIRLSCRSFH